MTLKKTGFSYFAWGGFVVLMAALVSMFWYFSGLLPDEARGLLCVVLATLTIVAVCLIAFAAGRLADFLHARVHPDPQAAGIVADLFSGVLLLAVFLVRILYLSAHVGDIVDTEGLFAQAMIVSDDTAELRGVLPILSAGVLRMFLRIAGNRIIVAAVVMALMQTVMVIGYYFGVRLLAGRAAAFVAAGIVGFLPALFPKLLAVSGQTVLFAAFALMFLLVALYLHFDAAGAYDSAWQVIWYIALGAALGCMLGIDLAAVILWVPLLSAFALPRADRGAEAVRLLIVFAVSFAVLLLFLIREGGMSQGLRDLAERYFTGTVTVRLFHLPTDTYPVSLAMVTGMAVMAVTFWRDRRRDHTTVWILFFAAAVFLVPLFCSTLLNAQELLFFAYAAVAGVGVAGFASAEVLQGRAGRMAEPVLPVAGAVPEGMVLPTGSGEDDGEPRMRMPDHTQIWTPLGLDRGQEGEMVMEEQVVNQQQMPQVEQPLSKAEQKALAKAQKAKARADAKAVKAEAKAAKKAERERLKMLADAEDEAEELAAQGLTPPVQPQAVVPQNLAPAQQTQGAQMAGQPVQNLTAQSPMDMAMQTAVPGSVPGQIPAAPITPGTIPAVSVGGIAGGSVAPVSLAAISPFAGRAPQTLQPNLIRNTAFNPDGSDDFDYEINGEDDFDV